MALQKINVHTIYTATYYIFLLRFLAFMSISMQDPCGQKILPVVVYCCTPVPGTVSGT